MNVQISCLWRGVVFGLLAAVVVPGMVLAQGQGQGRGGFGGGFGGGFPGQGGIGGLLLMEEVQTELKLTDDQKSKLREGRDELRGEAGGRRGGGAPGGGANFRDMSQEERQKFMEDARKRMQEQTQKQEELAKKVLSPEQITRLNELRVQQEGVRALSRAEVATALMLTDAQKQAVGDILEQSRPQRGPGGPGGGGPGGGRGASAEEREKARAEAAERTKKTQADIEAILTDTQKAEWTKLQGAKFNFPERPAFGRGGRGGQGGEGAPGGGGRRQRPNRPAPEA